MPSPYTPNRVDLGLVFRIWRLVSGPAFGVWSVRIFEALGLSAWGFVSRVWGLGLRVSVYALVSGPGRPL